MEGGLYAFVQQLWSVRNTFMIITLQTEEGSEFVDQVPQNYSRSTMKQNHRKGDQIEH